MVKPRLALPERITCWRYLGLAHYRRMLKSIYYLFQISIGTRIHKKIWRYVGVACNVASLYHTPPRPNFLPQLVGFFGWCPIA